MTREAINKICRLYLQNKLSMVQIGERLDIPGNTVKYWLYKKNIKRRTIGEAINCLNLTKFHKLPFKLRRHLNQADKELKIAGIMLYWGEGAKTGSTVTMVNSDPALIQMFLKFLRRICGVNEDRLRALIHMYTDQNENDLIDYWIKATKIPRNNFYKSYIHEGKKGTYKNKSNLGTIAIYYADARLFNVILTWLSVYKNNLNMPT